MELLGAFFMFVLQAAGMLGFFALILFFARQQRRALNQDWAKFAAEHGLEFLPPSFMGRPEIRGEYQGDPIRLQTISRSAGNSQVTYTVARSLIQAPVPEGFSVTREGLNTAIAKFFGGQDIQIGDATLDDKLRIKGGSPEEIRRALSEPMVQQALYGLLSAHQYSRVQRGQVFIEQRGRKRKGPELERMLQLSVALSAAFSLAFSGPWRALAKERGLHCDELGPATVIEGRVEGVGPEGVQVSIKADRKPGRVGTRMRVALPRPLPGKLTLALKSDGSSPIRPSLPIPKPQVERSVLHYPPRDM